MDKAQLKSYSKIAVTLGIIAAGSALLIGLANLITAGPIAQNELNKKLETIKVIYGDNAKYSDETLIKEEEKTDYPHLLSYFNAKDANGVELGNVFVTEGKNQYGKIKMAIGVNKNETMGTLSLIVNEQSFGPVLQEQYVDRYNKGEIQLDDVKCGATFGATLINTMSKEALTYYKAEILGQDILPELDPDTSEPEVDKKTPEHLTSIFGNDVKYGNEIGLIMPNYPGLKAYHVVSKNDGSNIGIVYICEGSVEQGNVKIAVGIKDDSSIGKISLIEADKTISDKLQKEYIDKYNNGSISLEEVECNVTSAAKLVKNLAKEAQTYYNYEVRKIVPNALIMKGE